MNRLVTITILRGIYLKGACILVLAFLSNISFSQENDLLDYNFCSRSPYFTKNTPKEHPPKGLYQWSSNSNSNARLNNTNTSCNSTDFSFLSTTDKIEFLKHSDDYECYRFLFTWDVNSPSIYTENFISDVFDEFASVAVTYDGTNSEGIFGLIIFLHTAIFHEFYQTEVEFTENMLLKYKASCKAFGANENIYTFDNLALEILYEYHIMLDFDDQRGQWLEIMIESASKISSATIESLPENVDENYFTLAYNSIFIYSSRGIINNDSSFIDSLEVNSGFINELYRIALDSSLWSNPNTALLLQNAVREYGRFGQIASLKPSVIEGLKEIILRYDRLSLPWLHCVLWLEFYESCQSLNVCSDVVKPELESLLFPNEIEYDNGKILFFTDKTKGEIDDLYFAIKEVQSQFFRMSFGTQPVPNDSNDTLKIILYPSRSSYEQYQNYLYGLPTNNGGIYIEVYGTFYTYDRLPTESIYSLEELLRHEYVHYLQGRYLTEGSWGNAPFYDNNRLVWFEEGMAEFLVGATRSNKIVGREIILSRIAADADRLNTSEITSSSYSNGFTFYRYAGYLFKHLYNNDINSLLLLNKYLKTGNLVQFDSIVNVVSSESYNNSYQEFLNSEIEQLNELINPNTNYPIFSEFTANSIEQFEHFENSIPNLGCSLEFAVDSPERFKIVYTCESVSVSDNLIESFNQIDSLIDYTLIKLSEIGLNNLRYAIGYPITDWNDEIFTYQIEGPLRDQSEFPDNSQLVLVDGNSSFAEIPIDSSRVEEFRLSLIGNSILAFDSIFISTPFETTSRNGIYIPNDTFSVTIVFKPELAGEFQEQLMFLQKNQSVGEITIHGSSIELITGLNAPTGLNTPKLFLLYPNPSFGIINMTNITESCQVAVYDIFGRSVEFEFLNIDKNVKAIQLSPKNYKSLILVQILCNNVQYIEKVILK